ncbi:response regulator [Parapedobacter koreensis]|uniref:cAMP-binding domain of CRP or a regulatory subunit of cAMP-dependent protein kinases n=1 Tax=Parapedobacter koreensis TaxID=332977 RepID=A0A1H7MZA1_9SPHI|nr:response regulator [Parapedobacter koreensis]SEL16389.1 cAMP-binding domain of CRP or a regulatory subunit of cAMP-dependent protein kinases [Parapedobacter koreensis]
MNAILLVIEDNDEIREDIADILRIDGYRVLTAPHGKAGIALALKHKPDLVLCDIMMPELDGYGVLLVLRKHPDTANTPFIFLTAKSERTDFRKGMSMGADDYLMKPFDGMELLEAVEVRLKKNEHLKTMFSDSMAETNEFQRISDNKSRKWYRKNDHIFREGQSPQELYHILRGRVKTMRLNFDGKELLTGMHREGQFIGYLPLLNDTVYTESAVALTDTEVGIIPKSDFQRLTQTNRKIASGIIDILSHNLFETEKRLLGVAYQSVRQRVASALIYFFEYQRDKEDTSLMKVSRKDMASFVGTALESLNRTLADFRDEQLIAITDGGIRIIAPEKLERISH